MSSFSSRSICHRPSTSEPFHPCLLLFALLMAASISDALHLTGVTTMPDHPRADSLSSFFHELIAELAEIGQFSYNIRMMPGAKYGGTVGESNTKPDGTLIGEVYSNRADFVIADLEITPEREKYIEFTRPFMRSKLAALVRRYPPPVNQTANGQSPATTTTTSSTDNKSDNVANEVDPTTFRAILRKSKRGIIRGSLAEQYFRTSQNFSVYHLLPSAVPSLMTGVQLVNTTVDYALISDAARLDLIAAHDCQYRVIKPDPAAPGEIGTDFEVRYAIGFARDSSFLHHFDVALEQLEVSGRLQALIDSHWTDYCAAKRAEQGHDDEDEETNGASSLTPFGFWLIGCCFWLAIVRH